MRTNSNTLKVLLYILIIALSISCRKEVLPIVITTNVTNISGLTAKSGGKILSEGTSAIRMRGVCWNTNPDPTINDNFTTDGDGVGEFTSSLTGLTTATTFYVRAYAANNLGIGYGKVVSFKTLGSAPTIETRPPTNLTATSATLNALVNSNYLPTTVTFEYGITTSYGISVVSSNSPFISSSNARATAEICGLVPDQIYHFRVKSENSEGIVYGNDVTFKTPGGAPVILKAATSSLSASVVVLYGNVNPNFLPSEVVFEVGTTTSYELPGKILPNPIVGPAGVDVTAIITGLTANSEYHFRIKAVNSMGTVYSEDVSFTTKVSDFPTNGLVAYYPFTGGAGLDMSGFGNHATITGVVSTEDRFSEPNEALQFDSSSDKIEVDNPDFLNNGSGSIVAWVRFDNGGSGYQYVAIASIKNYYKGNISMLRFDSYSKKVGLNYYGLSSFSGHDEFDGTTALSNNEYYQLVLTSDSTKWELFINGVKETFLFEWGKNTGRWFSSIPGLNYFTIGSSFKGRMDELLIYNRKLTDAEILGLYTYSPNKGKQISE